MMQFRFLWMAWLLGGVWALSGCGGEDPKPSGSGGAGGMGAGSSSSTSGSSGGTAGGGSTSGGAGGMGAGGMGAGGSGTGGSMPGPLCGDGMVQGNESCDDGQITMNCDTYQNGGDGKCVPAGTCSPGYFLSGNQCIPLVLAEHVHIDVDNFCNMSVMPLEYTVPAGQKLKLSYHNHSMDYAVDVWLQYGGGFLDLQQGMTWNDNYEHCFGPAPSENYADITTACSNYKLKIHCL